jgi:hypothetical protein
MSSQESQSELLAMRALVAARRMDPDMAELCEETENRLRDNDLSADARLRITAVLAEALLASGLPGCRERTERHLHPILENPEHAESGLSPADVLRAIVLLIEGSGPDPIATVRALLLVPAALTEDDANAWWALPHLLPHLLSLNPTLFEKQEVAAALDVFVKAASERPDCGALVTRLKDRRSGG